MSGRIISILLIIFSLQPLTVDAEIKEPGITAANFLKLGIGARPVAMGEAFCGVADDVNAAYWNPAGIAQIKEFQLTAIYKNWFEDINGGYLGYVLPNSKGVIGGSLNYLNDGQMQEIKKDKTIIGTFKAEDVSVMLSYAQELKKKFLVGVNLKYIQQKIADESGVGIAGDIGLIYKPTEFINIGMVVQNIGTRIKLVKDSFPLPLTVKTGLSYKNKGLTLALDFNNPMDNDSSVSLGIESKIGNIIALRMGYRHQSKDQKLDLYKSAPVGLTGGFGLGFGNTYFLDYAYMPYGDLGDTHRIAFTMKLIPVEIPSEEIVPPEKSPIPPIMIPEEKLMVPEEKPKVEEVKPVLKPEVAPEIKPEVKPEDKPVLKPEVTPEIKPEVKPEVKPIVPEKPKEIIPIKPPEILPKVKLPVKALPEPIEPKKEIIVLMDEVAIWSGPGVTYEKITTVHKGTKLILLDDSKKWYYKVLLSDGTVGWVCYVFVSK